MKRIVLVPSLLLLVVASSCDAAHRTAFTIHNASVGVGGIASDSLSDVAGIIEPIARGLRFQREELPPRQIHWLVAEKFRRVDIRVKESTDVIVVTLSDSCTGLGWSTSQYRAARKALGKKLRVRFGESNVTIDS